MMMMMIMEVGVYPQCVRSSAEEGEEPTEDPTKGQNRGHVTLATTELTCCHMTCCHVTCATSRQQRGGAQRDVR